MENNFRIFKNQAECSFEQRNSYPKNKRKSPSYPEETKSKKQKIQVDDFFQNASITPDGSDMEGIR